MIKTVKVSTFFFVNFLMKKFPCRNFSVGNRLTEKKLHACDETAWCLAWACTHSHTRTNTHTHTHTHRTRGVCVSQSCKWGAGRSILSVLLARTFQEGVYWEREREGLESGVRKKSFIGPPDGETEREKERENLSRVVFILPHCWTSFNASWIILSIAVLTVETFYSTFLCEILFHGICSDRSIGHFLRH